VDTERWARLSALLDEVLELEPSVRTRRLAEVEAADPDLGAELQRMLALEDERPDFLAESVVSAAVFSPQAWARCGWRCVPTACTSGGWR
jgi:eukaryotic-like serine/threonine-protein kinase